MDDTWQKRVIRRQGLLPWWWEESAKTQSSMAHLLVHYEFRFPEGQAARPANVHVDERIWPDREQRVGFRGREPAGGAALDVGSRS